ncbi:MAG: Uma2 family endonuclease [Desulfamplus sp.]|nr:Uma2 family endonuclease [Desulfamplus sp.]
MKITSQTPQYSPDQYLSMERNSVCKNEYINGHIFAMAGASRQHNQITFNISVGLGVELKNRQCVAYSSDMRVKISQTGLYSYPDIVATCNTPEFEDDFVDTLLNPSVIIEVLSDSTEAFDRGGKFAHYRRLDSLQEYILVAQDYMCVEHYARQGEQWILTEIRENNEKSPKKIVHLDSIGCCLSLREIYNKVEFKNTKGQP